MSSAMASTQTENVLLVEHREHVAILMLNRPRVHHAVDLEMIAQWESALDAIEADDDLHIIILSGSGDKTFCAGGDLRYFATLNNREHCLEMSRRMQRLLERMYLGNRWVIAAVNGQALGGGCEILTACHYRIAADAASFAFRQAPNGIITGWGGGRRLLRLLPGSSALRLLLSGEHFDAMTAQELGFVDEVVPQAQLLQYALELAQKVLENPPQALRAFMELHRAHISGDWQSLSEWETERFADLWTGPHFQNILKRFE
jgi:enoyl-CoA hydratase/carnithine racemase